MSSLADLEAIFEQQAQIIEDQKDEIENLTETIECLGYEIKDKCDLIRDLKKTIDLLRMD